MNNPRIPASALEAMQYKGCQKYRCPKERCEGCVWNLTVDAFRDWLKKKLNEED